MALSIVHHPDYDAKFPAHHRFPMGKYRFLMDALERRGLVAEGNLHVPEPIGADLLTLAHEPLYVEQVLTCTVPAKIEKEIGFPVGERVARRAHLATSGTLLAARLALARGLACNTAGGSHHARRAQGAGFCTFNDVGVAASALLAENAVRRILVIDLDVHQGDGTADIFATEPRVFTFSMHAEKNYPVRKIPSDLDIALPEGTGDGAYLDKLAAILPLLYDYGRPDIVFYNAGVDPHEGDRLGKLALSDKGLRQRDRMVIGHFRGEGIPVCGVIGGGYSMDVPELAERHATLFEVAAEFAGEGVPETTA
ncbi:histone deacetylase [Nitratireductor mangrovi]|uniref:Histone deacetylase n=1 Tax=Nitratireductor mangrovi TaxID=2599600 RepID=A0A5B8KYT1_9HYPH|nr:histone deacetylase [Nitratireductor mangrovi]QDZ00692.1 histone deacetylase [Nitratireductor mangrovi]